MEKNLISDDPFISNLINDILSMKSAELPKVVKMVKLKYVEAHHDREIFFCESKHYFRTYVGNPREEVTRVKKEDLIDYLYNYYKELEVPTATLKQVFERCELYRRDVLNRSKGTIKRDEQVFYRFYEESFFNRSITSITADEIAAYFNKRSNEIKLTERALKDSKQILERTFRYAIQQEKLLSANPVQIDLENYFQNCKQEQKDDDEKIFTVEETEQIEAKIRSEIAVRDYDNKGYAMLFSIQTGVRAGEIPTLRWSDVTEKGIHIHTQQRITRQDGKARLLEELPFTKNERRHPKGGRYFPLTAKIGAILDEIKARQEELGIVSEFIFCDADGSWMNKESYEQRLRRTCKRAGFTITNNHAFRMSLNSNVLIPLGIPVTQRAYLLGHSVEVNERNYSFTRTETLQRVKEILDQEQIHARPRKNIVEFPEKKIPQALVL